jgi:filamentous hemagglutinin
MAGEQITTINDLVRAIESGKVDPANLEIDIAVRGDVAVIMNTRTATALDRAGVPRTEWTLNNVTGNPGFETRLDAALGRNRLTGPALTPPRSSGQR